MTSLATCTFVNLITTDFDVKPYFLEKIKDEQPKDPICIEIKQYYTLELTIKQ